MAEDQMKTSFKYYKQKKISPDYADVIDFNKACNHQQVTKYQLSQTIPGPPVCGLNEVEKWKAYTLKSMPGFVFIVNPFQTGSQLYWVKRCLHDYHMKPSKTNLDIHMDIGESDNIWDLSQKNPKLNTKDTEYVKDQKVTVSDQKSDKPSLMSKLRWTTVGYHHDWNTKVYSKDNYSPVPVDLAYLTSYVAAAVGYTEYQTEAAIINYYHMDSKLTGHTDHSEEDKEAPLTSISFGQTAIFLVGGLTKEDKPIPMYLRSGDIVIMMGPSRLRYHAVPRIMPNDELYVQQCLLQKNLDLLQEPTIQNDTDTVCSRDLINPSDTCGKDDQKEPTCKLCFSRCHLSTQCKECCWKNCVPEINSIIGDTMKEVHRDDWLPFVEFMKNSRINMNARQVFVKQKQPDAGSEFDTESQTKRLKIESTQ